jgi:UDP-2-acetamido-3-amino-2,3-dideoxy-glucuronate N-acetyltransferase
MSIYIHPTAIVEEGAEIGEGAKIWHFAHVRKGAKIGAECIIGKGVFIDMDVHIGARTKIQNNVSVYHGVTIEEGVFIGPHVCFTNDLNPRAVTPEGKLRAADEWQIAVTTVRQGVSIGANSTVIAGVTLGRWSMVGAGSVVTRDIPNCALAFGNPARLRGVVAPSGAIVSPSFTVGSFVDPYDGKSFFIT